MFDLKLIRYDPDAFDKGMARRGVEPVAALILDLDAKKRLAMTAAQEARSKRNELSHQIGLAKADGKPADDLIGEVAELKKSIQESKAVERSLSEELHSMLSGLPNTALSSVPDGRGEDQNRLVREVGEKPSFEFEPKEHFDLGEGLGMMDFKSAARMSGARFVVLHGALARLERVLGQFMLDLHTTKHGYTEAGTPAMVKAAALYGTGQLPKFSEDLFPAGPDMWLIPTAEVTLTNLHREEILSEERMPLRLTALTQCFRAEAGAAGKDTRGMIRQHQFSKVEMVSITTPETSDDELERMTGCAEEVLKQLGLAYRVVELCTGDMGFSARRTYDLEVWLPGQNRYREISSCSTCGDFQARRMDMRCRTASEKISRFPHTLNGSGLALGRTLIAILENYQREDGSIGLPEVLHSYMNGLDEILAL